MWVWRLGYLQAVNTFGDIRRNNHICYDWPLISSAFPWICHLNINDAQYLQTKLFVRLQYLPWLVYQKQAVDHCALDKDVKNLFQSWGEYQSVWNGSTKNWQQRLTLTTYSYCSSEMPFNGHFAQTSDFRNFICSSWWHRYTFFFRIKKNPNSIRKKQRVCQ